MNNNQLHYRRCPKAAIPSSCHVRQTVRLSRDSFALYRGNAPVIAGVPVSENCEKFEPAGETIE
jgi:hypothetical protein